MIIYKSRTQRLTMIALLSAISFGLMLFPQIPIIPGASFLKLDFSIVPILIAGYWLNISSAIWVILLRTLLKVLLANEGVNTYLGMPVNVVAVLTFSLIVFWLMPKFQIKQWGKQICVVFTATLGLTIIAILMNWFVAVPLYAIFANFDIGKMIGLGKYIILMVVPFNLIQGLVWGSISFVVLSVMQPLKAKISS